MDDFTRLLKCFEPLLVIVAFIGTFAYFAYQAKRKSNAAWQKFAEHNNLTFVPGSFLTGENVCVTGKYRRYNIQLSLLSRDKREYTQMKLCVHNTANSDYPHSNESIFNNQFDVESVVNLLVPINTEKPIKGQIYAFKSGLEVFYEQSSPENDIEYLQFLLDLLSNLGDAYPVVVALGGEVVPALQSIISNKAYRVLHDVVNQLLRDIGQETEERLKQRASHLLCPQCLVRCEVHRISLPLWNFITYYGCRICGQSRKFFDLNNCWIIVVLNSKSTTAQSQNREKLQVNWLITRKLFDFDEVEIIEASDEDVERFAVQVGNDTDSARIPRYKQMRCIIYSSCKLSENTKRILQRIFGHVETKEAV